MTRTKEILRTRTVDFVGLDDLKLDDDLIASIQNAAQESVEKIRTILQQDARLKVHIKRHFAAQEQKRHKYSVVLRLEYAGGHLSIENAGEWDVMDAIKTAMHELESRINHVFKSKGVEGRDAVSRSVRI